jgi:hypothetical protein
MALAQRICIAAPELIELAAGAETCSLLLAVRLTAAARAEDGAHFRRPVGSPTEHAA